MQKPKPAISLDELSQHIRVRVFISMMTVAIIILSFLNPCPSERRKPLQYVLTFQHSTLALYFGSANLSGLPEVQRLCRPTSTRSVLRRPHRRGSRPAVPAGAVSKDLGILYYIIVIIIIFNQYIVLYMLV